MRNPGYEETPGEVIPMEDHLNQENGTRDHPPGTKIEDQVSDAFFRSEEMSLCQLFLQAESAYECVAELGDLGLCQFRDLNEDVNVFQRKYVLEISRCNEMERKLKYVENEIKKLSIKMAPEDVSTEVPGPRELSNLEATFDKLEQELLEVNKNAEALKSNYNELIEMKQVLRKSGIFLSDQDSVDNEIFQQNQGPSQEPGTGSMQLGFVAGTINREKLPNFEKMLWRASRGNTFVRTADIEEPLEDSYGNEVRKTVFIIFFQGEQLKIRVKKICDGFRCTLHPCPEKASDRKEMESGLNQRIEDLSTVLNQTNELRHRVLVSAAKDIRMWMVKVRKIRAIYYTMNFFSLDITNKCFVAECWVPTADIVNIRAALMKGSRKGGATVVPVLNQMETKQTPPTFFRTNKFTMAFQELIDAYGVAGYREMNPSVFTIITFPFLFGVMFGDAGHGLVVLCFGLWMCLKEKDLQAKNIQSEIWQIFFGGRYLITLMAIFSIYSGIVYNDVFSKSINIFGSSWQVNASYDTLLGLKEEMIDPSSPAGYYGSPYPFGVDPIWQIAENKIVFLNGFKMKISIIFGVLHMLFGVSLSFANHRFFKKPMNIFTEFIPQILFLSCMFGYLCLLMFIKWSYYYANKEAEHFKVSERCAPSILITFINMVLFRENEVEPDCDKTMYTGQEYFQRALILLALICVPWMLLAKPLLLLRAHKKQLALGNHSEEEAIHDSNHSDHDSPGGFNFAEIMILQGIHTIEYVLGSVSHTASYLRLWALSLAHAQLSEVLWNMVMRIGLGFNEYYGSIVLWAVFSFWAFLTVSILCLMEGLSAFLHTLRLHWVEFQSKFYHGDGYIFVPFAFKTILKQAENA